MRLKEKRKDMSYTVWELRYIAREQDAREGMRQQQSDPDQTGVMGGGGKEGGIRRLSERCESLMPPGTRVVPAMFYLPKPPLHFPYPHPMDQASNTGRLGRGGTMKHSPNLKPQQQTRKIHK